MSDVRTVRELAERRYDDFVDALREMVNVDCGSYTPEGVNAIADLCQARFERGGWAVERRRHEPTGDQEQLGDLVIGRLEGGGRARVMMIGHTDTVFDPGTVAERPFRIEGDRAFGPGVTDMKGGLLTGFFAVEVLQAAGYDGFGTITYICNPDEEIGSPWSRETILEEAGRADAALVLEGARENGDVVSSRKGVLDIRLEIEGRAAHAGVEPERGRSAKPGLKVGICGERPQRDPRGRPQDGGAPGAQRPLAGGDGERGCGARRDAPERRRRTVRARGRRPSPRRSA